MKILRSYAFILTCILALSLPFLAVTTVKSNHHDLDNPEKLIRDARIVIKALKRKYSSLISKQTDSLDSFIKETTLILTALTTGVGTGYFLGLKISFLILAPVYQQAVREGRDPYAELTDDYIFKFLLTVATPITLSVSGLVYLILKKIFQDSHVSTQNLKAVVSELHELEKRITRLSQLQ